ncbi:MAG: HRDC domain-containing protein [Vicinamibacterales bacterium]
MRNRILIEHPEQLTAAVARWQSAPCVALDTEFVRESTFRARLGLVQVATADEVALVDAVRIPDLSPLASIVSSPETRKILHSCSEDLPGLRRATGVPLAPLFDTQIAAAFAGLGPSLSYGALIFALFEVALDKGETRTDWMRRPLSPEQLRYAADDVDYLLEAAAELEGRLVALGRLDWAIEDSATLAGADADGPAPAEAWRKVKGLDRCPAGVQAVARELAAWREREAAGLDVARPFLLRDETLLALARHDDVSRQDVARLPGYDARRHATHAVRWPEALAAARLAVETRGPSPASPAPSAADFERRVTLEEAISALVARHAHELSLPPELLLSRRRRDRALDAWGGRGSLAASIGGFRGELLGAELDALARTVTG